jgi:hypothetical protein
MRHSPPIDHSRQLGITVTKTSVGLLSMGPSISHRGQLSVTVTPEPFAGMLLRLASERPNMNTAANSKARWLFPGRRAGQPFNPNSLLQLIRDAGILAGGGRTAALRQLVLQAPAPVIAKALGYHDKITTVVFAEAGGTWNSYSARRATANEGDP